ncbi:TonB-dependent receptor domain-containing protein [Sandaracinobacteroides hominis]|uniref:TonB-dependent receptor domain-containing protein n=1 Tax=Sandaracinobacteroides hominis TaxID=2780086 RepID=UPI0018F6640A|nr:TonB-dependent receptor [Sandaracinobacteroides hominis]
MRMMSRLLLTAALVVPVAAQAQQVDGADSAEDIVVTGSRIRQSNANLLAPVVEVGQQQLVDRGYVSAADALNDLPSNVPALNQADGTGETSGSGQQFPNLFGLGAGRTLTLVNGRRMVTSSSAIGAPDGTGDSQVDANIIPVGLLQKVEVYQGGGAAVYGSDAIAGVVNYVLRRDFTGVEVDGQMGIDSRGTYPTQSLRVTAGTNFGGGRGNIAVDLGYSKSPILRFSDRPLSNLGRLTVSNSANTGPDDGIPSVKPIFDARFWPFNANGIIFNAPAPPPQLLTRYNGSPLQFGSDGNVIPYNTGAIQGIPFASGGQGYAYQDLVGLRTGLERFTGNAIGHYDLTDNVRVTGEFLYARTEGTEIPQGNSRTTLNAGSYAGPIAFTINNPFLTAQAKQLLSAARPSFAVGAPLFLSKYFMDLVPDPSQTTTTDTWRGVLGLEGDFALGARDFYWSVSGSYGRVDGKQRGWQVINSRYNNAINAVLSGGQIVCGINADANPTNNDAACAPINPFGNGNVSEAARTYVSTMAGLDWTNEQTDFLATIGGSLFRLPAGDLKFSAAYEHRNEKASFSPLQANLDGSFGSGAPQVAQSGSYHTNELSGELLVPIFGGDFTVPLIHALELKGAFRYVDNSRAGSENVWEIGGRWEPVEGVSLRLSRSRNFRAPSLTQLLAPSSTGIDSTGVDPCDADRISGGPNPAVRRANCLALFAANPGYGVDPDGTGAGLTAAERLARFQNPSENFQRAMVTTGGNPNLKNEISDTWSYGIVLAPSFAPGLTFSADRVEIDLSNGLSPFTTEDFAAACYDNENPDPAVCSAFTRLANADTVSPGGTTITGTTTTYNAGVVRYRGEVFALNYMFGLSDLVGGSDKGEFTIHVAATHNSLLETSVTGETFVRTDDTWQAPKWAGTLNIAWQKGPIRLTYQGDYLGKTRAGPDATIENNPNPTLNANYVQSISGQFEIGDLALRAGVTNLTDRGPSYPQIGYGDILGRRFFVGARIRFN